MGIPTLSDYKGKTVFQLLATWCPPCRAEMPDIQKLYETYDRRDDALVVLGIAAREWEASALMKGLRI